MYTVLLLHTYTNVATIDTSTSSTSEELELFQVTVSVTSVVSHTAVLSHSRDSRETASTTWTVAAHTHGDTTRQYYDTRSHFVTRTRTDG